MRVAVELVDVSRRRGTEVQLPAGHRSNVSAERWRLWTRNVDRICECHSRHTHDSGDGMQAKGGMIAGERDLASGQELCSLVLSDLRVRVDLLEGALVDHRAYVRLVVPADAEPQPFRR